MTAEEVLDNLVADCQGDHVGLWEMVNATRFDLGSKDRVETRAMTIRLVCSLLHERGMRVGHPTPDGRGIIPWFVSPDQAVRRIESEWSSMDREPDIGDVAWFTSVP